MRARELRRTLRHIVLGASALASTAAVTACGAADGGAGDGGGTSYQDCHSGGAIQPIVTYVPYTSRSCDDAGADAGPDADADAALDGGGACSETRAETCLRLCFESDPASCEILGPAEAPTQLKCTRAPACGRRFEGLREATTRRPSARRPDPDPVASLLASCAHLEAASIVAFDALARELEALGAPRALVVGARRAARDEVRHARSVGRLARRRGARVRRVVGAPATGRTLLEVALENAVEGCVREAYGALVAWRQSEHAADAEVRRAMRRIAEDETRHASLAWSIAAWADTRLPERARRRVSNARLAAVRALDAELTGPVEPELVRAGLLPPPDEARRLLAALASALRIARNQMRS